MHTCTNCNHTFTYAEKFKAIWKGYQLRCPECGTENQVQNLFRVLVGLLIGLSVVLVAWVLPTDNIFVELGILILSVFAFTAVLAAFVRFKTE